MDMSHTVLLIDADLRKPSVHKYFEYEPPLGLSDYLREDIELSDILMHPGIDRFTVLPGRERVLASAHDTLSSTVLSKRSLANHGTALVSPDHTAKPQSPASVLPWRRLPPSRCR